MTLCRSSDSHIPAGIPAAAPAPPSRAGHYREDYPQRNNEDWLSWLHVRQEKGRPVFSKVRIPVEDYPVQPYRYYMDNFTFPHM